MASKNIVEHMKQKGIPVITDYAKAFWVFITFVTFIHLMEEQIMLIDVNTLGGSVHTIKENVEALVVVSKEIGLEVNANKTKHMDVWRSERSTKSQYKDW